MKPHVRSANLPKYNSRALGPYLIDLPQTYKIMDLDPDSHYDK